MQTTEEGTNVQQLMCKNSGFVLFVVFSLLSFQAETPCFSEGKNFTPWRSEKLGKNEQKLYHRSLRVSEPP